MLPAVCFRLRIDSGSPPDSIGGLLRAHRDSFVAALKTYFIRQRQIVLEDAAQLALSEAGIVSAVAGKSARVPPALRRLLRVMRTDAVLTAARFLGPRRIKAAVGHGGIIA
jgi:hypothetical protein